MGKEDQNKNRKCLTEKLLDRLEQTLKEIGEQSKDCNTVIKDGVEKRLSQAIDEMAEIKEKYEKLLKKANTSERRKWLDEKVLKDEDIKDMFKTAETLMYIVGMPAKQEALLDGIGGYPLKSYEPYRYEGLINYALKSSRMNPQKGKDGLPANYSIITEHPALDPEKIFTYKEAELQERLEMVRQMAKFRPKEVQNQLRAFESSELFQSVAEKMHNKSKEFFEKSKKKNEYLYKKEDECSNPEYRDFEDCMEMQNYDTAIEVLECLVGIYNMNTSKDALEKMNKVAAEQKLPPLPPLPKGGRYQEVAKPWEMGQLEIHFGNAEKVLSEMMEMPDAKKMSKEILKNGPGSKTAAEAYLNRYLKESVNRLLEPLYHDLPNDRTWQDEKGVNNIFSQEDLIIVGGMTVREHLDRAKVPYSERENQTALLVGAALQNGDHVELFYPDHNQKISQYPIQLKMDGCEVKKLEKIEDGFWASLLYRISDYFGWTSRKKQREEYTGTMQAREKIRTLLDKFGMIDKTKAPEAYERMINGEGEMKEEQKEAEAEPEISL